MSISLKIKKTTTGIYTKAKIYTFTRGRKKSKAWIQWIINCDDPQQSKFITHVKKSHVISLIVINLALYFYPEKIVAICNHLGIVCSLIAPIYGLMEDLTIFLISATRHYYHITSKRNVIPQGYATCAEWPAELLRESMAVRWRTGGTEVGCEWAVT